MSTTNQQIDPLRPHEFDGIQEYDNRLPNWWLWTFYLACVFSVFYWLHFHVFRSGLSSQQSYGVEMADYTARKEAVAAAMPLSHESLLELASDEVALRAGKEIWLQNCVQCHNEDGSGNIGPNMTDKYWIHGGQPMDLYKTVTQGVPDKGMVSWEPLLGDLRCRQVVAYVLSIKNTNVPNGKAPQGEPEEGQ